MTKTSLLSFLIFLCFIYLTVNAFLFYTHQDIDFMVIFYWGIALSALNAFWVCFFDTEYGYQPFIFYFFIFFTFIPVCLGLLSAIAFPFVIFTIILLLIYDSKGAIKTQNEVYQQLIQSLKYLLKKLALLISAWLFFVFFCILLVLGCSLVYHLVMFLKNRIG